MTEQRQAMVIEHGTVLLAGGKLRQCDLLVEEGRITRIGTGFEAPVRLDAAGAVVAPGFVDLHTHGVAFVSTEASTLQEFAAHLAARGATRFYPTLFGPPSRILDLLQRHRRETDDLRAVPQVGGFRLESPYLAYTGAGLPDDLAPVTADLTQSLLEAGGGHIKIWDISPELPGALAAIRQLTLQGVVCSMAHTRASIEEARAAVDAGMKMVTHLFDTFVVPEMRDPGVYPAGLIDYLLVEDRVYCEIIADGTHVHPLLVEKALRCKTPDRLAFITDGNYGAGLPDGEYVLPAGWGRVKIAGSNNGVRLIDREMGLAGSALTSLDVFRNAVQLFGLDLATASRVCSAAPARLLGLNTGEIAVGKDADLILLEDDYALRATIASGQVVYRK